MGTTVNTTPNRAQVYRVFRCKRAECGGIVFPKGVEGRIFFHRGIWIRLPAEILLPRCHECGMDFIPDTYRPIVDGALDAEYKRHERMIKRLSDPKRKPEVWN